jgi:hypothetical protein
MTPTLARLNGMPAKRPRKKAETPEHDAQVALFKDYLCAGPPGRRLVSARAMSAW